MSRRETSFYLYSMSMAAILFAALAALLAVLVDPYRMWNTPPVAGWTAMKPRATQQALLAKTYLLERHRPRTLLLGNSRIEVGFDPDSSAWPASYKPVFNAALAGYDLYTAADLLRDAYALGVPSRIIIGVDFQDFLGGVAGPERPSSGDVDPRILVGEDGRPNSRRRSQYWRDAFSVTLTMDAFMDSVMTLANQDARTSATITPSGLNPLNEYRLQVRRYGYHEIFVQKNRAYRVQYAGYAIPDLRDWRRNNEFPALAEMLRSALAHGSRVILVIHPYHSEYLEILRQKGLWDSFEAWKRAVLRMVDDVAGGRRALVQLWDFSGYNQFSLEQAPPPHDTTTQMRWYWEPGHYKTALGDVMIREMTGGQTPGFGRELSASNIDAALAAARVPPVSTVLR